MENSLPAIPAKRYFTIGEVGDLCGVKPHVLRYWEQEFTQLRPMKRRGNRRYYQHHEVLMIRRIRDLLYDQGFTIVGARNRLQELTHNDPERVTSGEVALDGFNVSVLDGVDFDALQDRELAKLTPKMPAISEQAFNAKSDAQLWQVRTALFEIRALLTEV